MKNKISKKLLLNIYTIPAVIITIVNIIVSLTDIKAMTITVIILNITFWITGILLYKKKNFSSLISIIPITFLFLNMVNSSNLWIDPYYLCSILVLFFLICDLSIFYKDKKLNKKYKKICTVLITIIVILSIAFSIIDYNQIKNNKNPIFMISLTKPDPSGAPTYKWEYIGLGYKLTINNEDGLNSIIDSKLEFRSWFYLFNIEHNTKNNVVDIIDTVEEEGLICAEALDKFYEDRENIYYYNCLKKDKIIVKYGDGTEKSFEEAFLEDITLESLDEHNIKYITEKKISTIGELSDTIIENKEDIKLNINIDSDLYLDRISDGYLDYSIINNNESITYGYGETFSIEVKKSGKWYKLIPPEDLIFTMPIHYIKPYETHETQIDLKSAYGNLESGTYRLIKEFDENSTSTSFNISVEFEIK